MALSNMWQTLGKVPPCAIVNEMQFPTKSNFFLT